MVSGPSRQLFLQLGMAGFCLAADMNAPPKFKGISDLDAELVVCICIVGSACASFVTMIFTSLLCQKIRGPTFKVPPLTYVVIPHGAVGDQSETLTLPSNIIRSEANRPLGRAPPAAGDAIVTAEFEKK
ncbi:hypothetical protein QR680_013432 [Steinernema hermaphroditum]|uniref:Uncharacterized protein n=1 Tax=Steinernema hermaphroditum TaxID=289476 RepID=A0AA39I5H7_9BILA|nr:hypothetical protein QR680_013432 [Steinernema hermaphroditum]